MKRVLASGIALVSLLGAAAGATAQEPAPPPTPAIQQQGRFTQRAIPPHAAVTGNFNRNNPEAFVTATVVLAGDSVSEAQVRAARVNKPFDAGSAERQVAATQAAAIPQIEAAGATTLGSVHTVLNAVTVRVQVKNLAALTNIAGVTQVHVSKKITRDNGTSDEYTGVPTVWADTGYTGAGMTIGVIDDGIDYYHADFGGSGDPADWENDLGTDVEPGTFPTAKVVGGYDFVGDDYDAGADPIDFPELLIPEPDADPLACGEHGTHVSGTAAGYGVLSDGSTFTGPWTSDTISANDWLVAPGAAPEASIRMYKVFGCNGSVDDFVLLDAIDMAVSDGVDVINMSLGSTWGTADEPIALAIDNATAAGVLSVVSAGNEGPAPYQVGGPSTANTALSVAAVDTSSTTLPGVGITGEVVVDAQNSNAWDYSVSGPITGQLFDAGLGCDPDDFIGAAGKIAVTVRGVCDRVTRAIEGTSAGALAVIFINNANGYPPVEGTIVGADIPFVGVPQSLAGAFDAAIYDPLSTQIVTLDGIGEIANPAYTNFASFTSNGPRQGDSAPKPDISAPGVNILSAFVGSGTEGELLSGTSMAAPHTAGIAILVRQAHPTWGPLAVKGAMMSTAQMLGVGDYTPQRGGAGMVDAVAAVNTPTYLSTADGRNSLAFGFRQLTGTYTAARSITINNTTGSAVTYDMAAEYDDLGADVRVTFSPSTVTVPANSRRSVSVNLKITDPENLPEADFDNGGLALVQGVVGALPRTGTTPDLITPFVLVPYGVSDLRAVGTGGSSLPAALTQLVSSIKVANHGVHYGAYDTYQWAITDPAGDNALPAVPDVRDVGIQHFDIGAGETLVVINVSLNERFSSAVTGEYDVWIDADGDDNPDYVLVGIDNGLFTGGTPDGSMAAFMLDVNDGFNVVDAWDAYAPNNGSVVQLPFLVSDITVGSQDVPWAFQVDAFSVVVDAPGDSTDTGYYNPFSPAVSSGDFDYLDPGMTTTFPVLVDPEQAVEQGALGWLVVTTDDAAGSREADRVPLRTKRGGRAVR